MPVLWARCSPARTPRALAGGRQEQIPKRSCQSPRSCWKAGDAVNSPSGCFRQVSPSLGDTRVLARGAVPGVWRRSPVENGQYGHLGPLDQCLSTEQLAGVAAGTWGRPGRVVLRWPQHGLALSTRVSLTWARSCGAERLRPWQPAPQPPTS